MCYSYVIWSDRIGSRSEKLLHEQVQIGSELDDLLNDRIWVGSGPDLIRIREPYLFRIRPAVQVHPFCGSKQFVDPF